MKEQQLIIESLLFVASEPLLQSDVSRVFDGHDVPLLDEVVNDINIKFIEIFRKINITKSKCIILSRYGGRSMYYI